jgi:hypothetical protein
MSLIIRWLRDIRSGNDLNCESSVVLIRKGLRSDGAWENPNSYSFSQHAVTYGRPVFFDFRSVLVPEELTCSLQVFDSNGLISGQ